MAEAGAAKVLKEGTCVWTFAESDLGPPEIAMGMSSGWILRLHCISTWLLMLRSLVRERIPASRLRGLCFRSLAFRR
jgi:hypothetical protein